MINSKSKLINRTSLYIFYGLLAYMPLHVFVSTVIGANLGQLTVLKILKDVLLMFGFCLVFLNNLNSAWFKGFITSKLTLLILAYATLTGVLAIIRQTDQDAEILGIVYNLRFLLFFLYGWLLCYIFPVKQIRHNSIKIVLGVGIIVVSFGIVQYLFLPNDALSKIGFVRANGVLPAFFIDDKPNLERVMSTIRDPNSLGSYLIIVTSLVLSTYLYTKNKRNKKLLIIYGALSMLCMYYTFSRSAWLGLFFTGATFTVLLFKNNRKNITKAIRPAVMIGGILFLVITGLLFLTKDTFFVRNVVFHSDQKTIQEDPNELRIRFIKESIGDIKQNPLGRGPGTAGLASVKNQKQGVRLNENYYLQITTEVGIAGVLIFLIIVFCVVNRIYAINQNDIFVFAILASFVGLSLTNILVHIWANEAVAYTWWGLAGLYMVSKTKNNNNNQALDI